MDMWGNVPLVLTENTPLNDDDTTQKASSDNADPDFIEAIPSPNVHSNHGASIVAKYAANSLLLIG